MYDEELNTRKNDCNLCNQNMTYKFINSGNLGIV